MRLDNDGLDALVQHLLKQRPLRTIFNREVPIVRKGRKEGGPEGGTWATASSLVARTKA